MIFPVNNQTDSSNYQLQIHLLCDSEDTTANSTQFALTSFYNGTIMVFSVSGSSQYGCPVVSFHMTIDFFANNTLPFGILLGSVGIFLIFFGLKMVKISISIITFFTGASVVASLCFEFIDLGYQQSTIYGVLAGSVVAGILLSILAFKYEKFAFVLVGAALGIIIGFIFYNSVIVLFSNTMTKSPRFHFIAMGVFALIGVVNALFLLKDILILATSVIGSYFFTRAISFFLGGFPSETSFSNGFNHVFFVYISAMIILAVLGMRRQLGSKREEEEKLKEGLKSLTNDSDYY
jgi:hypothetical protein